MSRNPPPLLLTLRKRITLTTLTLEIIMKQVVLNVLLLVKVFNRDIDDKTVRFQPLLLLLFIHTSPTKPPKVNEETALGLIYLALLLFILLLSLWRLLLNLHRRRFKELSLLLPSRTRCVSFFLSLILFSLPPSLLFFSLLLLLPLSHTFILSLHTPFYRYKVNLKTPVRVLQRTL